MEGKDTEANILEYIFLCHYPLWIMSVHYLLKVKLIFKSISENKPRQINLTIYQFSNITTQKNDYFSPQDVLTTVLWLNILSGICSMDKKNYKETSTKPDYFMLLIKFVLLFWNNFLILHKKQMRNYINDGLRKPKIQL